MEGGPARATVVDVSARDGLQSRPELLAIEEKVRWLKGLLAAGVDEVEAGSFVNPRLLPQMAGTGEVLAGLTSGERERAWVVVPNLRGAARAIEAGARHVTCLASATETHSRANLGRSIDEVFATLPDQHNLIAAAGATPRLALSMAWVDPEEGEVPTDVTTDLCRRARAAGFSRLTLCDTYGGARPAQVRHLIQALAPFYPPKSISLHLHDTFDTAAANTQAGIALGITRFETALAGLGGCPFAPGAKGNMDTLALANLLRHAGFVHNVDTEKLADLAAWATALLARHARQGATSGGRQPNHP